MALLPEEIFVIPDEAAAVLRSQLLAGDSLLLLRSGVAPMRINVGETGLGNRTTVGEPVGEVLEGDKKIVNKVEYTYLDGEWVRLSSPSSQFVVDVWDGNGDSVFVLNGNSGIRDYDYSYYSQNINRSLFSNLDV